MKKIKFNLEEVMNSQEGGKKKVSYTELSKIISKQWITTYEIQQICNCGVKKATKIRRIIEEQVKNAGKGLPDSAFKVVPTRLVLSYLDINEKYVFEMAEREQRLNNEKEGVI